MKKYLPCILLITFFLACGAVSYFYGYHRGWGAAYTPVNERVDTLVIRDTITRLEPQEIVTYKDRIVYVPVTDTLSIHDTTYVALQSEVKVYQDEDYRAVVSGIYPKLEEISVYPKTTVITDTKVVRKRWGLGVTVGPGVMYNGKIHGGVGIVAGLQYQF